MTESVIVTGASQGIGRAIAAGLAEAGHHVVNLDRAPPDTPALAARPAGSAPALG